MSSIHSLLDVPLEKLVMLDPDEEDGDLAAYFADALPYLDPGGGGCADCPPPPFLLPPPPRPPHLAQEACPATTLVPSIDTCDNILIVDSQEPLQKTIQSIIIVVVTSVVLVIALVLLVACIWRRRKGAGGCPTGSSGNSGKSCCHLPASSLEMKEVYDNPNYSHILIGGQPFFILPNGELSGHVPVPTQSERLTPLAHPPRQVYQGGGGGGQVPNYNLGSDCDTESCSTYRSVSEPNSSGSRSAGCGGGHFSPIYEEIVDTTAASCRQRSGGFSPSPLHGRSGSEHANSITTATALRLSSSPRPAVAMTSPPARAYQRTLPPSASPSSSSVYYYSDTLRRSGRGLGSGGGGGPPSLLPETDSGISSGSNSSHNTSSESTPRPHLLLAAESAVANNNNNGRGSVRGRGALRPQYPLPPSTAALSSEEDLSSSSFCGSPLGRSGSGRRSLVKPVETQVIDRTAGKRRNKQQPAAANL